MGDSGRAVFLSYGSEDAEAAQRLCDALRAAGVEVWFDRTELRGGDTWDQLIRRQIKSCHLFVPIISANTQAREEGYFRREWKLAVDRTHDMVGDRAFLLPVVIDDTADAQARVPEKFRDVQWTRLSAAANPDMFVSHVCRLLSPEATPPAGASKRGEVTPSPSMYARPPEAGPVFARTVVPWIVVGLLLTTVAYIIADRLRVSVHPVPAAEAIGDKSVAVLPFADMSENHDQEYFTDGLAEELINRLAQTTELKVIARTSSFQFRGKSDDVRAIAAKLSVANLVEGSIRRSGAHIRITVQLVRAADGTHIWSRSYDREDRDALKVQDEIASSVAKALSVSLHVDSSATPSMSEAYVLYLRGREMAEHGANSETNLGAAMDLLEQSVKLDPTLGIAYANLSRIRLGLYLDFPESYDRKTVGALALLEAERALELAPQLAESHLARARVLMWLDWDWGRAAKEMQLALQLEPGNATVQRNAYYLSTFLGHWDEALQHARRATEIDPLSGQNFRRLATAQMIVQAFTESENSWRMTLKLDPNGPGLHSALAAILWYEGRHREAVVENGLETDQASRLGGTVFLQFKLGHPRESAQALKEYVEKYGRSTPFDIGSLYADLGQLDEAFRWWNRAFSEHDAKVTYLLVTTRDPELPAIGSDPRFQALVRRLKLPEQSPASAVHAVFESGGSTPQ